MNTSERLMFDQLFKIRLTIATKADVIKLHYSQGLFRKVNNNFRFIKF